MNKQLFVVLSSETRGIHTKDNDEVEEIDELNIPEKKILDSDGFDCIEATTGAYLRQDGVKGHVIKHRPKKSRISLHSDGWLKLI